jgi:energy-coupling factor transporter ATP-binding protein EcfA2
MYSEAICPYPGLRPFTEEESIYFKGRELHIDQIIAQLEEKKFVMLTGASGDGKSSLVYAGVIPNARAGFFKAKYNNWIIADFRPERSPLKNFGRAIALQLEIPADEAEKELSYGFSSLVNLYKSSPFYLDYEGEAWLTADEAGQKAMKRKAANLFVLVDQFEEFFTNPENYSQGKTSLESQTVINLLLETTKIALEQNLPIYIICTMRSDYIGQCAAFRNLPEYIGFSQFFVPRLKRKEIQQVIYEPAILSGCSISQRLVEALINELSEGVDQLPILQETLHKIWMKAHESGQEMDLIHLAMLCGIPYNYLPIEQQEEFQQWKKTVPDFKQKYFDKPSLENVLDSHANELYETAFGYYEANREPEMHQLSLEETALIIKTAFKSLTKIDDNRAVRNRMTLQEITDMLQEPKLDVQVVIGVLNIFREEGNTFIKPFITNSFSRDPDGEVVLDITHEALIRNWGLLKQWSAEESENRLTYLDFNKQMQRWLQNKKSKDYLLPLGSLTFFEKWYEESKPSKFWLAKYDESSLPPPDKIEKGDLEMEDIKDFIETSRSTISRKRNLLIISSVFTLLILSGFTVWAMLEKKKAEEQKNIAMVKTQEAIRSKEEAIGSKNIAFTERSKAKQSEIVALTAKELAMRAKDEAEKANIIALAAKNLAEQEAVKADNQSKLATEQAYKAEVQKKIATAEKEKAEKAEQKALQLTLLSVSQNLALKSIILKEDNQLQGLMALQAFLINKDNKGATQDPLVFEGLRNAYTLLDESKHSTLKGSTAELRTLAEVNSTTLLSGDKYGTILTWDLEKNNIASASKIKYKLPVNTLYFSPTGAMLITGHENNAVCIWDLKAGKNTYKEILGKGLLRAVAFSQDERILVTAGKSKVISMWNLKSENPILIKSFEAGSGVKALAYHPNGTMLIAAQDDGNLVLWNTETEEKTNIFNSPDVKPLSLVIHKNLLLAGFTDGRLRIFDLSNLKKKYSEYNTNNTGVDFIVISKDGKMVATVGADKSVKIYSLANMEMNPIVLRDHNVKIRSIVFTAENKIIAGCSDNTIRIWETSAALLADRICPLLKRNMKKEEWEKYVGKEFPYQKTCKELP